MLTIQEAMDYLEPLAKLRAELEKVVELQEKFQQTRVAKYPKQEDYPHILTAKHIAEIMHISVRKAYEIMDYTSFPLIRLDGCKRVRKDKFYEWMDQLEHKPVTKKQSAI